MMILPSLIVWMFGKIGLAETDQRTYEGVALFGGVQFYDLFGDADVFVIVGSFLMLLDVDPDFISHASPHFDVSVRVLVAHLRG
jgi:hypothetical protein